MKNSVILLARAFEMTINQGIFLCALPPRYIWSECRRQEAKPSCVNYNVGRLVKNNHRSSSTKLLINLIKFYITRLCTWTCATSSPSMLLLIVNQLLNVPYQLPQLGPVISEYMSSAHTYVTYVIVNRQPVFLHLFMLGRISFLSASILPKEHALNTLHPIYSPNAN